MAGDPQPPGRAGGQRHARGDSFGGDMANGPSSSSAGWKREPPQTVQSSTGSSPSRSSFAADSGLLPIVRHSPSRVSIFIISAGVASHSGGVGARRGLREVARRCGEGTSIGSVGGITFASGSRARASTEGTCASCTGFKRRRGAFSAAQLALSFIGPCGSRRDACIALDLDYQAITRAESIQTPEALSSGIETLAKKNPHIRRPPSVSTETKERNKELNTK